MKPKVVDIRSSNYGSRMLGCGNFGISYVILANLGGSSPGCSPGIRGISYRNLAVCCFDVVLASPRLLAKLRFGKVFGASFGIHGLSCRGPCGVLS